MKIIDLSLDIYHQAPTFTWDPKCSIITHNTIESIGYNISEISMSTHQGTHLDAPYHFFNNGKTVNKVNLNICCGEAILVDVSYKKNKEPIKIKDFEKYRKNINPGSRIIYRTGWDKVFPDKKYFSDFPYMTLELAKWFTKQKVILVGIDTPTPNSVDWLKIHKILLGAGIILVEGLANLDKIKKNNFMFFAAPLKLKDRDGSPIRAFAYV